MAIRPAPGAVAAIQVRNLRAMQRAFILADKKLQRELILGLEDAVEPIKTDAQDLAREKIRRIGVPWSQMRIGVTRSLVYVAPKQRGRQSRKNSLLRRPNLVELLLGRAMEPALMRNEARVEYRLGRVLDTVGRAWESAA